MNKNKFRKIKKLTLVGMLCVGTLGAAVTMSSCDVLNNLFNKGSATSSEEEFSYEIKFELDTTNLELMVGEVYQIGATTDVVEWKSANEAIASIDENGVVLGVEIGSTVITATSDTGETKTCEIRVKRPSLVPTLQLNTTPQTLHVGNTTVLQPAMFFAGEALEATYRFETADASVATVNEDGVITAVGLGKTKVSVIWEALGHIDEESVSITVVPNAHMEISDFALELCLENKSTGSPYKQEDTVQILSLEVDGEQKNDFNVTWASEDESVATVVNGKIKARGLGSTNIIATVTQGDIEATATVNVTVKNEVRYTVKYIAQEFNGKQTILKTIDSAGWEGSDYIAPIDEVEGYTYMESASKVAQKLDLDSDTNFVVYYKSNVETISPAEIEPAIKTVGSCTWTSAEMVGCPEEDVRPGTYRFKTLEEAIGTTLGFSYLSSEVGKYVIFNVYFTKFEGEGSHLWAPDGTQSSSPWVGIYDENGKKLEKAVASKWLTFVLHLDPTRFPVDGGGNPLVGKKYAYLLSWAYNIKNDFYMIDYCLLTESEFNAYYGANAVATATEAQLDVMLPKKED